MFILEIYLIIRLWVLHVRVMKFDEHLTNPNKPFRTLVESHCENRRTHVIYKTVLILITVIVICVNIVDSKFPTMFPKLQ